MNYCLAFLAPSLSRAHHRPHPPDLPLLPLPSLTHSPVSGSFVHSFPHSITHSSLPTPRPLTHGSTRGDRRDFGSARHTFKRPLVILKHCARAMERDLNRLTTQTHLSFHHPPILPLPAAIHTSLPPHRYPTTLPPCFCEGQTVEGGSVRGKKK
ncbi:hypothetical protein E2C01_004183 [Portunus trituberculatus]|uniref:Uncharacterized protein n=1 Tax=Portunus trituberculatus TaxID=210409 RepID=A0A5B7CTC4_PORTR|nr:hypothetical protein [Portunus trituberculatus]